MKPRVKCPFCTQPVDGNLGSHIRQLHGEDRFRQAVIDAKSHGMPDVEIGERFSVSFRLLEQIITERYGVNISVLKRPKRIKSWHPTNFHEATTSVWSFRQRGNWATHDGRYRGNWSPYIPRNIIMKYSRPGDVVLDYFAGGGTTAVEAKLLGRRCIARDINPGAVGLTLENLAFVPPPELLGGKIYEPEVSVGDARDLSDIPSSTIDLICAHPPYAGIVRYSSAVDGDLSKLSVLDFLNEMSQVARGSFRVLKPGGRCAILIGDTRKSKQIVPIGFQTIRVFLNAGFTLRELIIKRQHNCRTTGFWYARSIQYNFLLLAHEYLPVFEKPAEQQVAEQQPLWEHGLPRQATMEQIHKLREENLETTTVWIFPRNRLEVEVRRNLLQRFSIADSGFIQVQFNGAKSDFSDVSSDQGISLVYVRAVEQIADEQALVSYRASIREIAKQAAKLLPRDGFLVLEASDVRIGEILWPVGLLLYEDLADHGDFALKEIVILVPEDSPNDDSGKQLEMIHRHLLIYTHR